MKALELRLRACSHVLPVLSAVALTLASAQAAAPDPFAEGVRPTPWQSPADQKQAFKLPPGFEIQLVAAEPDINKPMNLAFDAQGRLWVTTSIEYPFAAPTNRPGRDRIMVFEDFGTDGRARKVTQFADGLNIPIGIYPYKNGCIAWSIPNIWFFEDTDGDGKADKREVLYGPFDHTRDTHGNQASFRRGFDGWLYATHGFNNDSHVKGRDGHQVDLNSGNSYRIRLDGSRIEHHTHGQVNPFGLAFDPLGNLFSSDCHSEPLYQLLAGGYYPSFGKPHDGLGFAPNMMEKMRASTAIDGVSMYADDLWPEEYRGNLFFGDVMASRVMRDRTVEAGSTLVAKAMPDFVATDDPWFRPVDTCLGPDGAFYIADFYNKIIGHYEVPLTHPGRDRTSGRIWRIVYKGADGKAKVRPTALPKDLKGLVKELASPSLTRRMLAMNAISDAFGKKAVADLDTVVTAPTNPQQKVHALWLLHRLEASKPAQLTEAGRSPDQIVRVHAQRIANNIFHLDSLGSLGTGETDIHHISAAHAIALDGLKDKDALVQRCAAEAIARHRGQNSSRIIRSLLEVLAQTPPADTHLRYVVRKSIRDQLRVTGVFDAVLKENLGEGDRQVLAGVSLGVTNAAAATFLLRKLPELTKAKNPSPPIADVLKHAARYAPESELDQIASFASARIPANYGLDQYQELERQFALFKSVDDGLQQRGRGQPEVIRNWGTNLVWKFFSSLDGYHSWEPLPYEASPTAVPWDLETRTDTSGRKRQLTSSLPHGEALTGVLRSGHFDFPGKLTFWLCGHDGFPNQPAKKVNLVRLRTLRTDEILASVPAPRNDTARLVTWDLPQHKGKPVVVEAVDGDTGGAYAWIAFGDFEPELSQLRTSEFSPRQMRNWFAAATDTAVRLHMKDTAPVFERIIAPRATLRLNDGETEKYASLARAWVALDPAEAIPTLASALATNYGPTSYREAVAEVLAGQNTPAAQAAVVVALKSFPLKTQEKFANTLAGANFSAETLLAGIEAGAISPRVLQRVGVSNRLKSSKPADWENRVKKLTANLAPADESRDKLIADRRAAYALAPGKTDDGKAVFAKACASCHRIGTEGALIGPQLDGIGQRGLERLCEDILDPNRNVDGAFRTTLLVLKDGEVTSGLFRREEGALVVLAESTGKEITVPKANIAERRDSDVSLMPENFGEALSPAEFANLMAYLLSKRAQP
jgi:putative heme-binding domain-containing protein